MSARPVPTPPAARWRGPLVSLLGLSLALGSLMPGAAWARLNVESTRHLQERLPGSGCTPRHPGPPTTEFIVELEPGFNIADIARNGLSLTDSIPAASLYLLRAPTPANPALYADSLDMLPGVSNADLNLSQSTPEAIRQMVLGAVGGFLSDFTGQSLVSRLRVDDALHLGTGAGQVVAILDTGIDLTHDAFAGHISPLGRDFVSNDSDPSESANGIDDDRDGTPDDGFGHGTMVAGLVSLVAPDATILPVRVLDDEGRGDAFAICQGIQYAMEQGATVINISFGANTPLPAISDQIDKAKARGVVVVAGAGNNNSATALFYPAAYSNTIMVTAVDSTDVKASFADYDSHVTVSAPGTNVRSSYPGNAWAIGSGCSFATPLVAGEVALLRSANPSLDWNAIKLRVTLGVVPIDDLPGNAAFSGLLGSGRIDAWQALNHSATTVELSSSTASSAPRTLRALHGANRGTVDFSAPTSDATHPAQLRILDATGRVVRDLVLAGGPARWDGVDAAGRDARNGVYFAAWRSGATALTTRFVYLR